MQVNELVVIPETFDSVVDSNLRTRDKGLDDYILQLTAAGYSWIVQHSQYTIEQLTDVFYSIQIISNSMRTQGPIMLVHKEGA